MDKRISWLFSWLREVALILWAASLFYLPWFEDPSSRPDIYAHELILNGYESLIIAYGLGLLTYLLSRFTKWKAEAIIPLVAAGLVFLSIGSFGALGRPTGIPGRQLSGSIETMIGYHHLSGIYTNLLGVLAMAIGLLAAITGPARKAILASGSFGAMLGLFLFCSPMVFILMGNPTGIRAIVFYALPLIGAMAGLQLGKTEL